MKKRKHTASIVLLMSSIRNEEKYIACICVFGSTCERSKEVSRFPFVCKQGGFADSEVFTILVWTIFMTKEIFFVR